MWCGKRSVTNSTYHLLLYLNCPLCCYGKENSLQKCVCVDFGASGAQSSLFCTVEMVDMNT